jgi:hypothetical protein
MEGFYISGELAIMLVDKPYRWYCCANGSSKQGTVCYAFLAEVWKVKSGASTASWQDSLERTLQTQAEKGCEAHGSLWLVGQFAVNNRGRYSKRSRFCAKGTPKSLEATEADEGSQPKV